MVTFLTLLMMWRRKEKIKDSFILIPFLYTQSQYPFEVPIYIHQQYKVHQPSTVI